MNVIEVYFKTNSRASWHFDGAVRANRNLWNDRVTREVTGSWQRYRREVKIPADSRARYCARACQSKESRDTIQ